MLEGPCTLDAVQYAFNWKYNINAKVFAYDSDRYFLIQVKWQVNVTKVLHCLRNLSESLLCVAFYLEKVNLKRCVMIQCKTFCRKYLCIKCFILTLFSSLKKEKHFDSFYSKHGCILYKKIDWVGSLDACFQQVPLVQFFSNFHNIVMEHKLFKKQNMFFNKDFPNEIPFTITIA